MTANKLASGLLCSLLCASVTTAERIDDMGSSGLSITEQGSFFIGGSKGSNDTLSGVVNPSPIVPTKGHITTGQMYVQYQVPEEKVKRVPLVLIPGGGFSGQVYEMTPDGRMGWAEFFLRAGHPVYIVDQVGRGRSGFDATGYNAVRIGKRLSIDQAPIGIFSHEFAWMQFRIGKAPGVPFSDTQFPVDAIESFYRMLLPDMTESLPSIDVNYANLGALGRRIGGAVLVGHSQSFMFPQRAALADQTGVRGIISLESSSACATEFTQTERAILAKIPMLIVFADHLADTEESLAKRWKASFAQCREYAASIEREGGDVTFLHLPEIGMRGNSHMMMLDKNNLAVADVLLRWIDSHIDRK